MQATIFAKIFIFDVSLGSGYVSHYRLWIRLCFLYYFFHFESIKFRSSFSQMSFNPIQDGHFRGCSWIGGGGKKGPLPKICLTYPTVMKLGAVIPYLKKIKKIYESCDTIPEFCWHQHFLKEISKFCYIKKYRYRFQFGT